MYFGFVYKPTNWHDTGWVALYLTMVLGPPLLLGLFFLLGNSAFKNNKVLWGYEPSKEGRPPSTGIYCIFSNGFPSNLILGLLLGACSYPIANSYFSTGQAVLVASGVTLLCGGWTYNDLIFIEKARRKTSLSFLGLPLWKKIQDINSPYGLEWSWSSYKPEHRAREWSIRLTSPSIKAHELFSLAGETHDVEKLNRYGEAFAQWCDGRVFSYTPLEEVPERPNHLF